MPLQLFQAGFVAAGFQLIAVVLVTPVLLGAKRHGWGASYLANLGVNVTIPSTKIQTSLLAGAYLIISFGVALTENRFLDSIAMRIHQISHHKNFPRPTLVMASLLIQCSLGTAAFTTLALQTPPRALADLGHYFGWGEMIPMLWPGAMSIGVACYGVSAHAALRALQW